MQRISSLAACAPAVRGWKSGWKSGSTWSEQRQWTGVCAGPVRPFSAESRAQGLKLCRRRVVFVSQKLRLFSSQPGGQSAISVVGIPDPITWIRCKVNMYLINLYFEVDTNSVEFDKGVKQALVHVSNLMSSGSYHRLVGIVSKEMIEYVEKKCRSLTDNQRRQLAVTMEDIIFMLPEDVSVVFDQYGRKFCFVVMRFWLLTTHNGPDDPEGTKIFRVASSEDGIPQKKIVTAVYETLNTFELLGRISDVPLQLFRSVNRGNTGFQSELTRGASPDWTVTTVWHWPWNAAK